MDVLCCCAAAAACVVVSAVLARSVVLPDAAQEKAFWRSEATLAALRRYDLTAATLTIFNTWLLRRHFTTIPGCAPAAPGALHSWLAAAAPHPVWAGTFLSVACAQLLLIPLFPRAYSRIRHPLVLLNRALRLAVVVITVTEFQMPASRCRCSATRNAAALAPLSAAAKLVVLYSGAMLACTHSVACFLPFRYAVRFQLATVLGMLVPWQSKVVSEVVSELPAARAALAMLGNLLLEALEILLGIPLPLQGWGAVAVGGAGGAGGEGIGGGGQSDGAGVRAAVVAVQVLLGFVVPMMVSVAVEGRLKSGLVLRRRPQGAAGLPARPERQLQ